MAKRAAKSISRTLVWILMGLLFVGLAGFGATNLSGTVRTVGAVGETPITVDEYARALQQEMRSFQAETGQPLTFQQAQALGLPQRALSQLIATTALDNEAAALGLSVGDEAVAQELMQVSAFQGTSGRFDRETYAFVLEQSGLSESEFEEDLRRETARTLLQAAIISGNPMPDTYGITLLDYIGETRSFTWARLDASMLDEEIDEPTEEDLAAYHAENIDAYTLPETRDITYAWVTPDMLIDTVEVDETALRKAYEEQSEIFNRPERRLVERLIMPDQASADDARAALDAGEATFEQVVTGRGLALADVDMGDITRADLGANGDPVFEAEVDAIVGPLPTDLGPALFRVNGVLPAQETPFEDAEPALREQLAQDRARRVIDAMAQDIDDLLAGGATLEELAQETAMELGQIAYFEDSDEELAGYDAFREAAAEVSQGDYPEIAELGDGGIFALRLNAVNPPRPQPLEEVRAQVEADWATAEIEARLMADALALASELGEGKTFEGIGLEGQRQEGQTRTGFLPGLPGDTLSRVFELQDGDTLVLPHEGSVILLQLDAINAPDLESQDSKAMLAAVEQQVSNGLANDLFNALAADVQARNGITINQQALNAVHANFQ